jgi:hypothetical protein
MSKMLDEIERAERRNGVTVNLKEAFFHDLLAVGDPRISANSITVLDGAHIRSC